MISRKNIIITLAAIFVLLFVVPNFSRLIPESKNYKNYQEALAEYGQNDFQKAYSSFGKVSRFSKLKPAAIYRQALCADKLDDKRMKFKKYKQVIKKYPGSTLAIKSKYVLAQTYYEEKNYRKAKREFREILRKYPKTDFGVASQYYLGSIETSTALNTKSKRKKNKAANKAIKYFRNYLLEAPTGRFAKNCAQKWTSLNPNLKNEDNLIVARVYLENKDYKSAQKHLRFSKIALAWPYFVKCAFATKDYSKVKYYTELGMQGKGEDDIFINETIDEELQNKNTYEAIDLYLKASNSPKTAISYLLAKSKKTRGYDYLLFKNCKNLPESAQMACFNTLYYEFPKGQFAAESLANIFYGKIRQNNLFTAKKIGQKHLSEFPNVNSSPKVMFWMAKLNERTKNYNIANNYYKSLINKYPDDYYAFHAFLNINRFRHIRTIPLTQEQVEFPYKNGNYGLITELAKVKDYGLINLLCKDDKFVQSWLSYLQGDFANSSRIARDAMDEMKTKPHRNDPKWKLVYPIHYYDIINDKAISWYNDPVIILSIIREESYFNPKAKSPVGARGLMQLMPATAKETAKAAGISLINEEMLYDSEINITLGNAYYSRLKSNLDKRDILAILAYNGGIGSVSKWKTNLNYVDIDDFVEQIPYSETQNYLKKVYKSYWNYIRIYDGIRFKQ